MKKLFLIVILFYLLFASCKKNESTIIDIDYGAFQQCKESQQWDSTLLTTQLVGSWELYAISCAWSGKHDVDTMDVQVDFGATGNFIVKKHGITYSQGSWNVASNNPYDSTNFQLELTPNEQFISGEIFLCTDKVLFYESGYDLCDKVYNRIQ